MSLFDVIFLINVLLRAALSAIVLCKVSLFRSAFSRYNSTESLENLFEAPNEKSPLFV